MYTVRQRGGKGQHMQTVRTYGGSSCRAPLILNPAGLSLQKNPL